MRGLLGLLVMAAMAGGGTGETHAQSYDVTTRTGVPYAEQRLLNMDEITGGSPYGASTLAGGRGDRLPSENELGIARYQGRHVAQIAAKLFA